MRASAFAILPGGLVISSFVVTSTRLLLLCISVTPIFANRVANLNHLPSTRGPKSLLRTQADTLCQWPWYTRLHYAFAFALGNVFLAHDMARFVSQPHESVIE